MLQKNKLLKNMSYADAILSATKIMLKKIKMFLFLDKALMIQKDIMEQHSIFIKILEIIDVLTHQYARKA